VPLALEDAMLATGAVAIKGAATLYRIAGTTKTFVKLEGALAYAYEATPGLKTMVGTVHDKLLSFGLALEGTTVGKAFTKVGETAERAFEGVAGAGRRVYDTMTGKGSAQFGTARSVRVDHKDVFWVDENAAMSDRARRYNDSVTGARSNIDSRMSQAPSIKYLTQDGIEKVVRFDGVSNGVLIDRKIAVVTTEKAKGQALRQSEALTQNNFIGIWEVPSAREANRALKMFESLGVKNIGVKIVELR